MELGKKIAFLLLSTLFPLLVFLLSSAMRSK
jgi:hypothetical protein